MSMSRSRAPYPPGHPRRDRLRKLLRNLGAAGVAVSFESRRGRYVLLSYGTQPTRHRLAEGPTEDLRACAMAQIRQALPRAPGSNRERGEVSLNLAHDRVELGYRAWGLIDQREHRTIRYRQRAHDDAGPVLARSPARYRGCSRPPHPAVSTV